MAGIDPVELLGVAPDIGRVHACTVNGHDAQHWYDQAQRWKREASSAAHDGANRERRKWWRATGYEFVTWYEKDHPRG